MVRHYGRMIVVMAVGSGQCMGQVSSELKKVTWLYDTEVTIRCPDNTYFVHK
uniref:Uncharacterized protein n=1 Tax=Arundo donax TaxID=35708 RepID=A0A0A8YL27_ARUDO